MIDWLLETGFIGLALLIGVLLVYWSLRGIRSGRSKGSRDRWWRISIGVVLTLLALLVSYSLDGVYLLGVALMPEVGLLLIGWGIWGDRSKGRTRCPNCWYDMRGTVPRLTCPECGHDAKQRRRLYRNRRGWRRIALGVVLLLLSAYPLTIIGGWAREQAAIRTYDLANDLFQPEETIGPAWLVERLPNEVARFFERRVGLRLSNPEAIAASSSLRHLRWIKAWDVQVTDADLVHLKGLSNLARLSLADTQVTDAGLAHIRGLANLTFLDLRRTQVTDAGLAHVAGLPNLASLYLGNTQVTGAGLMHLKELTKLATLDLSDTRVTGAGLVHLKELSNLDLLFLTRARVGDMGLAHLKGLSKLKYVYLWGTLVTDAGLVHLVRQR